ncbi:hypothetical protein yaldo0001_16250 [Yersinia aldovae ATCC 35236]|nr:hypothetical protein yaldo0001_16250 [Yersinia aldovae ATCC 35236]
MIPCQLGAYKPIQKFSAFLHNVILLIGLIGYQGITLPIGCICG